MLLVHRAQKPSCASAGGGTPHPVQFEMPSVIADADIPSA
jgi:hypothetical protein